MEIWPGSAYPLGASFEGTGVNLSVFSEVAERVELCLFDAEGMERRIDLPEQTALCWHGYVPNLQPGQRYGFRVHGPYRPAEGLLCNPQKLLIDPYARAIEGQVQWSPALYNSSGSDGEVPEARDSATAMPKSVITNPWFNWAGDSPPHIPWSETVIYELHVKGFTQQHPEIPPQLRGTYLGLVHPVAISHLQRLGITAVELMPCHQFIHDQRLVESGLRNYWGYNSIAYFAPHNEYSSGGDSGQQVQEFKEMVRLLHQAGVEVILDVVYNHTAEGNHLGPTLSLKGLDNAAYYRLSADDRRYYIDYTGTGNSLNMRHPHVLQLIMDSLRYWVQEMHVDGFRFDLASTLARELHDVDRLSAFFDLIQQDPVLSQVKLIAEPWDVGEGGYQVGNFPALWSEWNGRYRDTVRDYWRGEPTALPEFASRFAGSSDLYKWNGRKPHASINFVTCHDGFTLRDLVSYNQKHNQANGEQNQDGSDDNRAWNCETEGPTDDEQINHLRARQQRNLLSTLLLSQGVPMLAAGDELGRSQQGNNNAYCQDNPLSWINWEVVDEDLLAFAEQLLQLRREHSSFRRRRWFQGQAASSARQLPDIAWFKPDGEMMNEQDWHSRSSRSVGVFLNGDDISSLDSRGHPEQDKSFLVIFNANGERLNFTLPGVNFGIRWLRILDTAALLPCSYLAEEAIAVEGHSVCLLQRVE